MSDMEIDESLLCLPINHHNFPAKLWSLANNPQNSSIFWSPDGNRVIIDQQRFEADLMSPVKDDHKLFKTTNFTSFIRQLNLYGFRKVSDGPLRDRQPNQHHFYNPNFRQGQPELLVNLKRLTISNKAKILAGEKVTSRAPRLACRKSRPETTMRKDEKSPVCPYQYHNIRPLQLRGCDRPPTPSYSWPFQYSDVSPFYPNRGIPVSVIRRYSPDLPHWIPSCPTLPHQQLKYVPHHFSCTPGFLSAVICQCCRTSCMEAGRTSSDQTSFSHYGYFTNYPVRRPPDSFPTPDSTPQDRCDINLDRVFEMVEEFQGLTNVHTARVNTPVKPQHTSDLSETSASSLYTLAAVSESLAESEPIGFQSFRPNTVASSSVSSLYFQNTIYMDPKSEVHKTEGHRGSKFREEQTVSSEPLKQVLHWSAEDQRLTLQKTVNRQEDQTCGK